MKVFEGHRVPIKAWVDGVEFEDAAFKQVENGILVTFLHKHVAIMPDVHAGIGATVGSVIATSGVVIPAAVGVDTGCGMIAVKTVYNANDLPDDLSGIRAAIEKAVPHGRTDNGGVNDRGAWHDVPNVVLDCFQNRGLAERLAMIESKHPKAMARGTYTQLGTLGTGNHFIEICLDENDDVWIILHSGSRGAGNRIGSYFIEMAKKDMERYFVNLPDRDSAYLPEGTTGLDDYIEAVSWAQDYATINRALVLDAVKNALETELNITKIIPYPFNTMPEAVNCHHNYVAREHHFGKNVLVTRKGAVRARAGDLGIIPGSMGVLSYIVRGKGNKESFESCSHGAGRRMSRTEAASRQRRRPRNSRATCVCSRGQSGLC